MRSSTVWKLWQKNDRVDKGLIIFFLLGAMIAITSLFRGILVGRQVQIEYLEKGENSNIGMIRKILVDIEGAVISPGVYQLEETARVKDVLMMAGGYTASADRSYCEKNINLAQPLKDGQKIYVPEVSDTPGNQGYSEAKNQVKKVNVNLASLVELDTLWGVGAARAETIVKNRPYSTTEELVSKGGMTKQIYEKNKDLIVLY